MPVLAPASRPKPSPYRSSHAGPLAPATATPWRSRVAVDFWMLSFAFAAFDYFFNFLLDLPQPIEGIWYEALGNKAMIGSVLALLAYGLLALRPWTVYLLPAAYLGASLFTLFPYQKAGWHGMLSLSAYFPGISLLTFLLERVAKVITLGPWAITPHSLAVTLLPPLLMTIFLRFALGRNSKHRMQ